MTVGEMSPASGTLVFRGRFTEEDIVGVRRVTDRLRLRRPYRWLARGFAALMGVLMTWYILEEGPDLVSVLFLVACVYILFILPFERVWSARRHYRRRPDDFLDTEVRLTADRVSMATDAYRTEFAWSLLGGVADAPEGILFYSESREPILWLPDRLFEENNLRAQVLDLAFGNGVRVSRI